ncbi:hypothetical protein GCM10010277_07350 [Streptomyces longisporoflavus]|uniref:DUF4232 domain-containing protein n=1 Tax=Streptomyces longisporoflavus TaxID=28044 RepID=UPI00167EC994|nr:DUF4232 domain-containing protein [Streptomyces longisporoflavus]GGV26035.1 hypothetical protein GCM10010277_07350 [Streptomyces longisporoflavus]
MRVHKLTFAALAVAASLSLTACNDEDAAGGDPAPASSSSSADGGSGADGSGGSEQGGDKDSAGKSSGGQGADAGAGSGEDGKLAKCHTDELEFSAQDSTIDGDTEGTVAVTLQNGGGRDCAISGFAGVDLKTSAGALSAKRTGEPADPGVLKDGESVSFAVTYPMNDSGGSGVSVTGLVVTPPGETKSSSLAWPGAKTLPVTDGSGSPVKVGAIGSAGQGGAS